ncbi:MAG: methyltransferase domain-containing protein [Candidatus Rokubacteria bacterium]|nr:methyltransferase domain-containing protein [Candidatus Rokubacteria bacterium]
MTAPTHDRLDAPIYDDYQTGVAGDVPFYVEQARAAGGPVLELGCGTGRILIPVAGAGVKIVGLDISPSMLAVARDKIGKLPVDVQRRITLHEGDMRDFALGRTFPLVTIPYRAFLHLLTVEDQRRALACIHRHLDGGGQLVLNVFDPSLPLIVSRIADGGAPRRMGAFTHAGTGRLVVAWESFVYDLTRQMLDGHFIFDEYDASGLVVEKRYAALTLRWVYRYEMQHLLESAGFAIEALYSDFERTPFRAGGEQVWVARKR